MQPKPTKPPSPGRVHVYNTTRILEHFMDGEILYPQQWGELSIDKAMRYLGDERLLIDTVFLDTITQNRAPNGRLDAFTLASPWSLSDGYGRVGTLTLIELLRKGYRIRPVGIGWENRHNFSPELHQQVEDNFLLTKWSIIHGVPSEISKVRTPCRVLWTMWECERLPEAWKPELAKYPDMPIIVPSHAMIKVFRDTGVNNPIHVVPDCIESDDFPFVQRPLKRPDPFQIFSWSHMTGRKCPLEMIDVFYKAFGGPEKTPDVRLLLKTTQGKFGLLPGQLPTFPNDPRITIVSEFWTTKQIQDTLAASSAGLFLSHGEGYFLEPLEATLSGLPCVVPSHSGCSDWANEKYFYPVRTAGMEDAPGMGNNMRWFVMEYDHAAERLREIYDNYPAALAKAQKGSAWIKKNLDPSVTSDLLVRTLDKIDREYTKSNGRAA